MTSRALLFTDAGSLRAVWRIALFLAAASGCVIVASVFIGPIITMVFSLVRLSPMSNETWVVAIGLIGATVIAVRWIDPRPWSDVWLGADAARPALLGEGFLVGTLAIGVPVALLIAEHWLERAPGDDTGSWAAAAFRISVFLLPAALYEELVVRGYIFAVLRESWGWKWTLVVTSIVFGLLHLRNPGADLASTTLVTLAGLFLGGVLVATRSVYAAWMAHFAWNWTMAVLFHTAVSGFPMAAPGYRYVDAGPDWATGGPWGPEGGIPAGIGMGAGAALVYLFARRRRQAARHQETEVKATHG